ncbi:MAG: PfkB family carbohydrate kinase, partial [Myxococcota bacterium]|nr:PfkB family carbohydrate kinase [Myxococcota bacterium]
AAIHAAFAAARQRGVTTVYDPMLHRGVWPEGAPQAPRAAFEELLPLTDLLVISAPFATGQLLQRANPTEAANVAQRRGLSQVVIRHGRRGCVVVDRDGVSEITAPTTGSARTTPLGEAVFNGALMSAMMAGESLADAARAALRCADVIVDAPDTVANLPPARALTAALCDEAPEVPPAP